VFTLRPFPCERAPPRARALLPATRCQSSGPLGVLLSSPALDVRLMTALQVLQGRQVCVCYVCVQQRPRPGARGVLGARLEHLRSTWSAGLKGISQRRSHSTIYTTDKKPSPDSHSSRSVSQSVLHTSKHGGRAHTHTHAAHDWLGSRHEAHCHRKKKLFAVGRVIATLGCRFARRKESRSS